MAHYLSNYKEKNNLMDKEAVYRYYGWRIEDGDYEPGDKYDYITRRSSKIGKFINLLIAVFVMRFK